jgi:CHAD domain-containing protein
MAYELDPAQDAATNVRRIIRERVDEALDALAKADGRGGSERIHTARKRFKEIRAALRLMRRAVDAKLFRKENRTYRDAARPLSEVRDAEALVEALDSLLEHFRDELKGHAFDSARRFLLERRRSIRHAVIVERDALREVRNTIRQARRRVERRRSSKLSFRTFADGIRDVYRAGRRAMATAIDDETDETFHEWRKQAKYLRHQAEVLQPTWPAAMKLVAKQAHDLADLLGDDHDLAVMNGLLKDEAHDSVDPRERKALSALIRERRSTLQKRAERLGRKLFAEKPKAFRRRVREYIDVWAERAAK